MKDIEDIAKEYAEEKFPILSKEEYYKTDYTHSYSHYRGDILDKQEIAQAAFISGSQYGKEWVSENNKKDIQEWRVECERLKGLIRESESILQKMIIDTNPEQVMETYNSIPELLQKLESI